MNFISTFAFSGVFTLATLMQATAMDMKPATATDALPHSDSVQAGDLDIGGAFTRAMLPGQPVGGGYFTMKNNGASDDTLVTASSPVAGTVELHEMAMQGEVMRMRRLNSGIAIPAGATIELSPGGLHLMFMKVKQPFKAGDSVPVTLTFEKAGTVDIALPVRPAGPTGHQHP